MMQILASVCELQARHLKGIAVNEFIAVFGLQPLKTKLKG